MKIYKGVIEDNKDPEKRGRYRVRVFGLHTENKFKSEKEGIPTNELMWCEVMVSADNPVMNGIGKNWILPQGTWVLLTFLDEYYQQPLILGVLSSCIPKEPSHPDIGFNDPDGKYPKITHLHEPDINRLVRNEKINQTYIQKRNSNLIQNIQEAFEGNWSEPSSSYNAEYPYNKVIETESGIIVEFDDTPNNERINIYHPSITYEEINKNGNIVKKITGNFYTISLKDMKIYAKGNISFTTDKNFKIKGKKLLIEIDDEIKIKAKKIKADADDVEGFD